MCSFCLIPVDASVESVESVLIAGDKKAEGIRLAVQLALVYPLPRTRGVLERVLCHVDNASLYHSVGAEVFAQVGGMFGGAFKARIDHLHQRFHLKANR